MIDMDEGNIRFYAQVCAVNVEVEAIAAAIKGMEADNKQRELRGESMAWSGDTFFELEEKLKAYAERLKNM